MKFSEIKVDEEFLLPVHPKLALARLEEQVIEVEDVYQYVNAYAVDAEGHVSYWYIHDKAEVEGVE